MNKPTHNPAHTPDNGKGEITQNHRTQSQRKEENIDEALDESFPASDPPPWTPGPAPVRHERKREGDTPDKQQRPKAERTPEERKTSGHGPGKRFEELDERERQAQAEPHRRDAQCGPRTDMPGRRVVPQGPHEAFPGERPSVPEHSQR
ncbi:hypothetical protein [Haliangium ochraceum]|uniref:Uncharacterized protein n=1 Tax=Haliangium ochraceum (strain DSM 14365 / JCM 11303 / SMP-2) TaxID=502025 RepID=D0LHF3_HALO1|nr:hypothetical protein [Haliangium ochraceum]ACY12815.1 hypothetical protein Hoch_0174 [Haliangium ochraceum DSM 14365]